MTTHTPGASAPIVAVFSTTTEIRVIVRDGDPWFVLNDVAAALEFDRGRDAARMLDDDEKGAHIVRTPGGDQELTIINESGLYSLILKSRKPEAKKFKKWVTSEVLPSIRKTGTYSVQQAAPQPVPEPAHEILNTQDMNTLTQNSTAALLLRRPLQCRVVRQKLRRTNE
jgi:prophage antirepressor-like protein